MPEQNADHKRQLVRLYSARARCYDLTANLYYLLGYREWQYRRQAIAALNLEPGDTVIEVGCGTGLNFGLLQDRIGPAGRLIGVDLTGAMLARARRRVATKGWRNVELVPADAATYAFPPGVHGVIVTYALSLVPECALVIEHAAQSLAAGGRLVVLDLQIPDNWPRWLAAMATAIIRPFLPVEEWLARRPWQTIRQTMQDNLVDIDVKHRYLSTTYIISGRSRPRDI